MLAFDRRPLYLGISGASCGCNCGEQRSVFVSSTTSRKNIRFHRCVNVLFKKFNDKLFWRLFTFKKLQNNTKLCYSHLDQLNCPRCSYESGNWFRVSNIDASRLWTRQVSQNYTVTIFIEDSKGFKLIMWPLPWFH